MMDVLPDGRPRATWVPHSIRRYESLWLLMHKFAILNRPTPKDVSELFGIFSPRSGAAYLTNPRAIGLVSHCNIERFAAILGEPVNSFQYSTADPFMKAKDWLFDSEHRFCPECLNLGYHTVLFAASGMVRCPLHDVELRVNCLRCDRPFSMWLSRYQLEEPGRCGCGHTFIDENFLNKPPVPDHQLDVFQPLIEWLITCSGQISIDVADDKKRPDKTRRQLLPHMHHWPLLLGVVPPGFLVFPPQGHSISSGDDLVMKTCEYHTSRKLVVEARRNSLNSEQLGLNAVYKAIRRQLTKVVFGNHTASLYKLARTGFLQTRSLPVESFQDKKTALALAFLLWRSRIECWPSIGKWLAPRYDRSIRRPGWKKFMLQARNAEMQWGFELVHLSQDQFSGVGHKFLTSDERAWVSHHVSAHGFLYLWRRAVLQVDDWASRSISYCGQWWEAELRFPSCSCLRTANGAIALTLPVMLGTTPIPLWQAISKAQRVEHVRWRRQQQWQALTHELNKQPYALEYSPEKGWAVRVADIPDACARPLDIKQRRLMLPGLNAHFILFQGITGNFKARSLEFPIQVSGHSPSEAIKCLKQAVRTFKHVHSNQQPIFRANPLG